MKDKGRLYMLLVVVVVLLLLMFLLLLLLLRLKDLVQVMLLQPH